MGVALGWMGNCKLPKRIMVGTLEKPERRERGEKEWTDGMADDLRMFRSGDGEGSRTAALEPSKQCETVIEGVVRFMVTRRKE